MKRIEYKYVDKSEWGDGPWQAEPDKIQWLDEETKLPCIIKRSPSFGGWCGYVGVSKDHPCFGRNHDELPHGVDVHGGLTFSGQCQHDGEDHERICHLVEEGESDIVWWLGFDCGHWQDHSPTYAEFRVNNNTAQYRDQAYVTAEVESLARQLKGMQT